MKGSSKFAWAMACLGLFLLHGVSARRILEESELIEEESDPETNEEELFIGGVGGVGGGVGGFGGVGGAVGGVGGIGGIGGVGGFGGVGGGIYGGIGTPGYYGGGIGGIGGVGGVVGGGVGYGSTAVVQSTTSIYYKQTYIKTASFCAPLVKCITSCYQCGFSCFPNCKTVCFSSFYPRLGFCKGYCNDYFGWGGGIGGFGGVGGAVGGFGGVGGAVGGVGGVGSIGGFGLALDDEFVPETESEWPSEQTIEQWEAEADAALASGTPQESAATNEMLDAIVDGDLQVENETGDNLLAPQLSDSVALSGLSVEKVNSLPDTTREVIKEDVTEYGDSAITELMDTSESIDDIVGEIVIEDGAMIANNPLEVP